MSAKAKRPMRVQVLVARDCPEDATYHYIETSETPTRVCAKFARQWPNAYEIDVRVLRPDEIEEFKELARRLH